MARYDIISEDEIKELRSYAELEGTEVEVIVKKLKVKIVRAESMEDRRKRYEVQAAYKKERFDKIIERGSFYIDEDKCKE